MDGVSWVVFIDKGNVNESNQSCLVLYFNVGHKDQPNFCKAQGQNMGGGAKPCMCEGLIWYYIKGTKSLDLISGTLQFW